MHFFIKIKRTLIAMTNFGRKRFLRKAFGFSLKGTTIFSNNCIAGFLYSNCKSEYMSPTIGLQIPLDDFFAFVNNYNYYLGQELIETNPLQDVFSELGGTTVDFPCADLEGVKVLFQHEKDFCIAKSKWERRAKRINKNRIAVVMFVKKELLTGDVLKRFESIPYPKILISNNQSVLNKDNCFFVDIPAHQDWFSFKNKSIRFFEEFDFKTFFQTTCENQWHSSVQNTIN